MSSTTSSHVPLFRPLKLRELELTNRIVVSPMCQYSAVDGSASDWHTIHLGYLSASGASLMFVEATAVEAEGRITPGDLGLYSDDNEKALGQALASARRHGTARFGIQLAHAGRKASCALPWEGGAQLALDAGGWTPSAPSPLPYRETERAPAALDEAGLLRVKRAFVSSAERAARLGFDVVELHCAHGYLLHEFLSPLSNKRTDGYGGSRENRMRFPLEVFEAVRAVLPERLPFGVRVSATDWVDGGWDLDDTAAFAERLRDRGCDFVDCSSGGLDTRQKLTPSPGFQVQFARHVKVIAQIKSIAVGAITDPVHANKIIDDEDADLIALARGFLWDPRWGWHAAEKLGVKVAAPNQVLLANRAVLVPKNVK